MLLFSSSPWSFSWSLLSAIFIAECVLLVVVVAVVRLALSLLKVPRSQLERMSALVTGCDNTLGQAVAFQLVNQGWGKVFAACLTRTDLELFKRSIPKSAEDRLFPLLMDVRERHAILHALKLVHSECPRGLDVLVNNAGVLRDGYFEMVTFEEWQLHFEVNTLGTVRVTKAFMPLLRRAKGRIITTTSVCGRVGMPALAAYSSSIFALRGFSESLRRELKPWGVSVVLFEPGMCAHDFLYHEQEGSKSETERKTSLAIAIGTEKPRSPSEKRLQRSMKSLLNSMDSAIMSRYPRNSYRVGWDAWMLTVVSAMPSFAQDLFFEVTMAAPLPAALSPVSNLATPSPKPFFRLRTPPPSRQLSSESGPSPNLYEYKNVYESSPSKEKDEYGKRRLFSLSSMSLLSTARLVAMANHDLPSALPHHAENTNTTPQNQNPKQL